MRFFSFRRRPGSQTSSRKQPARCRPAAERLEDRTLLAVSTWVGGARPNFCDSATSGDPQAWTNPFNGLERRVPAPGDTAVFRASVFLGNCGNPPTPLYGPLTNSVLDAAFGGTVAALDMDWSRVLTLGRALTVTGASTWAGGTIRGPPVLTNSGTPTLAGGADKYLSETTLRNPARINHTGTGPFYLGVGGVPGTLDNQATGTYEFQSDASILNWNGAGVLTNAGTLSKSAGAGTTHISTSFANTGIIFVLAGTLALSGGAAAFTNAGLVLAVDGALSAANSYTQAAGALTYLVAGTLTAPTVNLAPDSLFLGAGTVNGNVTDAGILFVGDPGAAGTLTVNGNYTQTDAGFLLMELGRFDASEFDVLNITGAASLRGLIFVDVLASFVPREGDNFTVLTFGSRGPGDPVVLVPDLGSDLFLDPVFGAASLTLQTRRS